MATMKRSSAGSRMSNVVNSKRLASALAVLSMLATAAWAADPGDTGAGTAGADPAPGNEEVRAMGGTSVIGNRELPKSLYIVPWKNSEVGVRTDLSRDLLDEGLAPVDPREFERQVQYHDYHHQQ